MAEVQVRGLTEIVETDYLILYFECKRLSAGGPILSYTRDGAEATITFQNSSDAEDVLNRAEHTLKQVTVQVSRAAPWDPGKVALLGVKPDTSEPLLDIYVENVSDRENFTIQRSAGGSTALIIFQEPLTETDYECLAQRVAARKLNEATLSVQRVRTSNEVLIENVGPQISTELLGLYLESKRRSGGSSVHSLTMLRDRSAAIVTFQDWQVVERVLSREHSLQGSELKLSLYYPALLGLPAHRHSDINEPSQQSAANSQQSVANSQQSVANSQQSAANSQQSAANSQQSAANSQQSAENSQQSAANSQQSAANSQQSAANSQQRAEHSNQLGETPEKEMSTEHKEEQSAEHYNLNIREQSAELRTPQKEPNETQSKVIGGDHREQSAANTQQSAARRPLTMADKPPSNENTRHNVRTVEAGHVNSLLELEVCMKPAELRFLQEKHHEVLAGMDQVMILPLESEEKTGFMVSGDVSSCQSTVELLQLLLSSLSSKTVTLEFPGVSRFLLENEGQRLLRDIETQYHCVIDTSQLSLRVLECEYVDPWSLIPQNIPKERSPSWTQEEIQQPADMENIRVLASVLINLSSEKDSEGEPEPGLSIAPEDREVGIYSDNVLCDKDDIVPSLDEELEQACKMSRNEYQERELDEESELLLAIQRSMDSRHLSTQEDDELQKALLASMREQALEETEESLQRALEMSVKTQLTQGHSVMSENEESSWEEVEQALDTAKLVVVVGEEKEMVVACAAFRKAVSGKLCTETWEGVLDVQHSGILSALQKKHAVSFTICGEQAAVQGFTQSPTNCLQELRQILSAMQGTSGQLGDKDMQLGRLTDQDVQHGRLTDQDVQHGRLMDQDVQLGRLMDQDVQLCRLMDQDVQHGRLTDQDVQLGVELLSVSQSSEEYVRIIQPFQNTLHELKDYIQILEVHRVQNALLSKQYELKKSCMLGIGSGRPVERILYHGTTESSAREIYHNGFNRSFCGKNAALYGQGVYFAVQAVLSARDNYSPPSSDGKKYVLVAKVLTGNFTLGKSDMRTPPTLPLTTARAPQRYDSLVDSVRDPSIFVIFNDTQAYPQYVITCTRISKEAHQGTAEA